MVLTLNQLKSILPSNKEVGEWLAPLNSCLEEYKINTPLRIAAFLAQTGHESRDFTDLEENLYYTAPRLMQVWPSRFKTLAVANQYAKNPQKFANNVYANRMGNGSPESGDGWRFRGQGIKQLTGRDNYTRWGKTLNMSAEEAVKYIATKEGAIESACWYWKENNLDRYADNQEFKKLTYAINGGYIGYEDRLARYKRNLINISNKNDTVFTIDVKAVQTALRVTADGDIGPITLKAIKIWQKDKGYPATGDLTKEQFERLMKED